MLKKTYFLCNFLKKEEYLYIHYVTSVYLCFVCMARRGGRFERYSERGILGAVAHRGLMYEWRDMAAELEVVKAISGAQGRLFIQV